LQFILKPIAAGDCFVKMQAAFHILVVKKGWITPAEYEEITGESYTA
jgi:hypothetical protein